MSVSVNQSRLGDFELLEKLGEGGMGAVYKARQLSLDRIVALKVLPRRLAAEQKFIDRFIREARATARLNHPNIVAGFDVTCSDGYNYFVMEFVEGVTLRSLIQKKNGLPEEYVLRVGAAMAAALAHAHKAGIIHRDVKPENILIDGAGVPKLTDLGLSKVSENQDGYLTQAGLVVGTAYYIAPEQARGDASVDGRADVYALGCTLYHAATGSPPFEATTPAVLMVKHISEKMPHPRSLQPHLSDEFCACLSRMVTRKAGDRSSAAEAARDLEALAAGKPWTREPLPEAIVNFLPAPKEQPEPDERDVKISRTALGKSVAAALLVRPQRAPALRRRQQRSWTAPALIISAVLLVLTYLISTYVINTSQDSYLTHAPPERARTDATVVRADPPGLPAPGLPAAPPKPAVPPAPPPPPAEVKSNVPLVLLQLDPAADRRWRINAPDWTYADGALRGSGQGKNAYALRGNILPRDFEMFMTIQSHGAFHFGWGGNFFQRASDGVVILSYWDDNEKRAFEVAKAAEKLSDGLHEYHFIVKGASVRVTVDGHPFVATEDGKAPFDGRQPARDLGLYAGSGSTVDYRKIQYRDLTK